MRRTLRDGKHGLCLVPVQPKNDPFLAFAADLLQLEGRVSRMPTPSAMSWSTIGGPSLPLKRLAEPADNLPYPPSSPLLKTYASAHADRSDSRSRSHEAWRSGERDDCPDRGQSGASDVRSDCDVAQGAGRVS